MNHPEHILRTLDSHLAAPTRLILYGRAALALGYPNPIPDIPEIQKAFDDNANWLLDIVQ